MNRRENFEGRSRVAADAAKLMVCAVAFALLAVGACHLPDLNKIHLGACIKECNATSQACLGAGGGGGSRANTGAGGGPSQCPKADRCFNDVQHCSDAATSCSDTCPHGDTECLSGCSHQANDCIHKIRGCVSDVETCATNVGDNDKKCLTDLVGCVAECASDAEAVIKGKR